MGIRTGVTPVAVWEGQVISRQDIDFLIVYLRRELDNVDRAIDALEHVAQARRAAARLTRRPVLRAEALRGNAAKAWTHHRVHAG